MVDSGVCWYLAQWNGGPGLGLKAAAGDAEYVIDAGLLTHEEKIGEPPAAVYECGADIAEVVLLRPDGKGLYACGSHSCARMRGAEESVL